MNTTLIVTGAGASGHVGVPTLQASRPRETEANRFGPCGAGSGLKRHGTPSPFAPTTDPTQDLDPARTT